MTSTNPVQAGASIVADLAAKVLPQSNIFTIQGRTLKLDSRADIEPHVKSLLAIKDTVEEIHFGGNTLGVEACAALAEALPQLRVLKVRLNTGWSHLLTIPGRRLRRHIYGAIDY